MDAVIGSFSGRTAKYTWTMTRVMRPTPASPCRTYIKPQVMSLNKYGLRGKKMVRTRDIMNTPVTITDNPVTTMAP